MSAEKKAVIRRLIEEVWNKGKLSVADELLAKDHVDHSASGQQFGSGPEGLKRFATTYKAAFPDAEIEIEEQLVAEDKVVTRWTGRGTHRGELLGIPPTGKRVAVSGLQIDRVEDGKIVESWGNWDQAGMLMQLGVLAPPGEQPTPTGQTHYARVTTIQGLPEQAEEAIRFTHEEVVPKARQMRGFVSYLGLLDRKTGRGLAISLWESEEAMRASEDVASQIRAQAVPRLGAPTAPTVDRYEVIARTGAGVESEPTKAR